MKRLEQVLESYGADPGRWPAEERSGLESLLAESPDARALRDDAARLDSILDKPEKPIANAVALPTVVVHGGLRHGPNDRIDPRTIATTRKHADAFDVVVHVGYLNITAVGGQSDHAD